MSKYKCSRDNQALRLRETKPITATKEGHLYYDYYQCPKCKTNYAKRTTPRGREFRDFIESMVSRHGDEGERAARRTLIARFIVNNGLRGRGLRDAVRRFEQLVKGG